MAYQPTRTEGQALHQLAIALRPSWENNNPGQAWYAQLSNGTFPNAESFEHCVQALINYCNDAKDGKPRMRTPSLYPGEGDHWERTRPKTTKHRIPCPQHPDNENTRHNCSACRSEILAGMRPPDKMGITWKPQEPPADEQDAT